VRSCALSEPGALTGGELLPRSPLHPAPDDPVRRSCSPAADFMCACRRCALGERDTAAHRRIEGSSSACRLKLCGCRPRTDRAREAELSAANRALRRGEAHLEFAAERNERNAMSKANSACEASKPVGEESAFRLVESTRSIDLSPRRRDFQWIHVDRCARRLALRRHHRDATHPFDAAKLADPLRILRRKMASTTA